MVSSNSDKHVPDAVSIILPPGSSFPLVAFVSNIAADPCFTARKHLGDTVRRTSEVRIDMDERESVDPHNLHELIC